MLIGGPDGVFIHSGMDAGFRAGKPASRLRRALFVQKKNRAKLVPAHACQAERSGFPLWRVKAKAAKQCSLIDHPSPVPSLDLGSAGSAEVAHEVQS